MNNSKSTFFFTEQAARQTVLPLGQGRNGINDNCVQTQEHMRRNRQPPQTAKRYTDPGSRSFRQRLEDPWFAPKRFESTGLYEHLGVLPVKRYAPTGGDYFIRRYGIHIVDVRGTLDSLTHFERYTRRLEAIHEIVFLGFVAWSIWRAAVHQTTLLDLGFAIVVYVILILSPAMLQRYNRLRLYPAIQRLAASRARSGPAC